MSRKGRPATLMCVWRETCRIAAPEASLWCGAERKEDLASRFTWAVKRQTWLLLASGSRFCLSTNSLEWLNTASWLHSCYSVIVCSLSLVLPLVPLNGFSLLRLIMLLLRNPMLRLTLILLHFPVMLREGNAAAAAGRLFTRCSWPVEKELDCRRFISLYAARQDFSIWWLNGCDFSLITCLIVTIMAAGAFCNVLHL